MKIIRPFVYLMLIASLTIFTACSSDDDNIDDPEDEQSKTDDKDKNDGVDIKDLDLNDLDLEGTATAKVDFIDEDEKVDFSASEVAALHFLDFESFLAGDGEELDEYEEGDDREVLVLAFEDDGGLLFKFIILVEEIKLDFPYKVGNLTENYILGVEVGREEDDAIYQAVHYDIDGEVTKSEGELIIEKISDDGVEGSFEMTIHKPNDDLSDIKEVEISKGEFDVTLYQFKDKKLVK